MNFKIKMEILSIPMLMYRCVCLCIWMRAWMCARVCLHVWMCTYECMHGYVCMCVCMGMYLQLCVCMCECTDVYICVSACVCEYTGSFCINTMSFAGYMSLYEDSWLSAFDYTQTSPKPLLTNPNQLGSHHTQAWSCQIWVFADVSAGWQESRRTDQGVVTEKCMPVHPRSRVLAQP